MNTVESQILAQTFEQARAKLSQTPDPAHGWEHVQRVYYLALYIAEREGADRFITGMAALLHDIGRAVPQELAKEHEKKLHHAELSEAFATGLLRAYNVGEAREQAILHAIRAHSFSLGVQPETLEARAVRDADRLDALGAIGIMRWAITGAVRYTPETLSYHPDDPFAAHHTPDDRRYMLDHFYQKLLLLEETMLTETGRQLARPRTAFMHAFLKQLRQELLTDVRRD